MVIRPTEAVVDLSALVHNYRLAVELGGRPAVGVVKANAYGHGAVAAARALVAAGAPLLAVALVEEGVELREAGIRAPVLVLGGGGDLASCEAVVRHGLAPVVFSPGHVAVLGAAARAAGARVSAHLEVDTGMGRLGIVPEELPAALEALRASPEVELAGVCTHFSSADLAPRATTEAQIARFAEVVRGLERAGRRPALLHLANSAGTLLYPEVEQDLTRPGIMLYGYSPFDPGVELTTRAREAVARLRPVLTWRTAVLHVKTVPPGTPISYGGRWIAQRTSRIATLPVGYADGYDRRLSGRPGFGCAEVLVRGVRVPVVGTVCMDLTMIDVTDVPGAVAPGDEVVLVGAQGGGRVGADELAQRVGSISYEILCGISGRVPRRHV